METEPPRLGITRNNNTPTTPYQCSPSSSSQSRVNMLHLELVSHFTTNMRGGLFADDAIAAELGPKILKYAIASPFLMCETLSLSALHLSTLCPERRQCLREESAKLQTEALQLFTSSVKQITVENVIPAFLYTGILGLHHFCDTFSMPSKSLDSFLDRLVQSIKLLRGIPAILSGWWEFLLSSDVKLLLQESRENIDRDDEVVQHFRKLSSCITESVDLDPHQCQVYEAVIKQMTWVYRSQPTLDGIDHNHSPWMITTWPILVSSEFIDLLSQQKPEALLILSYFSVLLHKCRKFWTVGDGGRFLLEILGEHLGGQWEPLLAWPKSIIYMSAQVYND